MKPKWEKWTNAVLKQMSQDQRLSLYRKIGYTSEDFDFIISWQKYQSQENGKIYMSVKAKEHKITGKSELREIFNHLSAPHQYNELDFDEREEKLHEKFLASDWIVRKPMNDKEWNNFWTKLSKEKEQLIKEIKTESNENKRKNQTFGYGQKNISVKDVIDDIMEVQNNKKPKGRTQTIKEILNEVDEAGVILEKMLGKDRLDAIMVSIDKEIKV